MTELPPTLKSISEEKDCHADDPGNCRFHRTGKYANQPPEPPSPPSSVGKTGSVGATGAKAMSRKDDGGDGVVNLKDEKLISQFCKTHNGNEWIGHRQQDGSVTFSRKSQGVKMSGAVKDAPATEKERYDVSGAGEIAEFARKHDGRQWIGYRHQDGSVSFVRKGSAAERQQAEMRRQNVEREIRGDEISVKGEDNIRTFVTSQSAKEWIGYRQGDGSVTFVRIGSKAHQKLDAARGGASGQADDMDALYRELRHLKRDIQGNDDEKKWTQGTPEQMSRVKSLQGRLADAVRAYNDKNVPVDRRQRRLAEDIVRNKLMPLQTNDGVEPVAVAGGRSFAFANINGNPIGFYRSSGKGNKIDVQAGKWFPFFGKGSDGWINKTNGKDINSYYGSPMLRAVCEELDRKYPHGARRASDKANKWLATAGMITPSSDNYDLVQVQADKATIAAMANRFVQGVNNDALAHARVMQNAEKVKRLMARL